MRSLTQENNQEAFCSRCRIREEEIKSTIISFFLKNCIRSSERTTIQISKPLLSLFKTSTTNTAPPTQIFHPQYLLLNLKKMPDSDIQETDTVFPLYRTFILTCFATLFYIISTVSVLAEYLRYQPAVERVRFEEEFNSDIDSYKKWAQSHPVIRESRTPIAYERTNPSDFFERTGGYLGPGSDYGEAGVRQRLLWSLNSLAGWTISVISAAVLWSVPVGEENQEEVFRVASYPILTYAVLGPLLAVFSPSGRALSYGLWMTLGAITFTILYPVKFWNRLFKKNISSPLGAGRRWRLFYIVGNSVLYMLVALYSLVPGVPSEVFQTANFLAMFLTWFMLVVEVRSRRRKRKRAAVNNTPEEEDKEISTYAQSVEKYWNLPFFIIFVAYIDVFSAHVIIILAIFQMANISFAFRALVMAILGAYVQCFTTFWVTWITDARELSFSVLAILPIQLFFALHVALVVFYMEPFGWDFWFSLLVLLPFEFYRDSLLYWHLLDLRKWCYKKSSSSSSSGNAGKQWLSIFLWCKQCSVCEVGAGVMAVLVLLLEFLLRKLDDIAGNSGVFWPHPEFYLSLFDFNEPQETEQIVQQLQQSNITAVTSTGTTSASVINPMWFTGLPKYKKLTDTAFLAHFSQLLFWVGIQEVQRRFGYRLNRWAVRRQVVTQTEVQKVGSMRSTMMAVTSMRDSGRRSVENAMEKVKSLGVRISGSKALRAAPEDLFEGLQSNILFTKSKSLKQSPIDNDDNDDGTRQMMDASVEEKLWDELVLSHFSSIQGWVWVYVSIVLVLSKLQSTVIQIGEVRNPWDSEPLLNLNEN